VRRAATGDDEKAAVTEFETFVARIRELVWSLHALLTPDERSEVEHLIDHGEPSEALRTLAWIIVDDDKRVAPRALLTLRELSAGLVDALDLPPNLERQAAGSPTAERRSIGAVRRTVR